MNSNKLIRNVLLGFNLLTILFYSYAPITSSASENHILTLIYVIFCLVCWNSGFKRGLRTNYTYYGSTVLKNISNRTINYFFAFYLITFIPKYCYELSCPLFDIGAIISRVMIGLIDAGAGYQMARGAAPFNWFIYFFISVIDSVFFIVGMICWKRMVRWQKYLFVPLCIFEILKWFGKGTNMGVIIMIVTFLFSYLASKNKISNRKSVVKYSLVGLTLFLLTVIVFARNMEGRSGGDLAAVNQDIFDINYQSKINDAILNILPDKLKSLYLFVVSYLTGGYTNLECAFNCDHSWTFFMGSNPSKANLFEVFSGIDVNINNYPAAIEKAYGIDQYINWHSCYAWLANDFGLWGVPVVVFVIGKLTSKALLIYQSHNDLLSGIVFVMLANMCIFFFANNNYISSVFYSFLFLFPLWLFSRRIV